MPAAMLARGISVLALIATCAVAAEAQTDPGSRIPDPARASVDKTGVFFDSLALLGIEHGIRLGEPVVEGLLQFQSAAAKHGVVGLMRLYANLLAPYRIRVNTLHPTGVNTPMIVNESFARFVEQFPDSGNALENALPVELIEPEDIANAAAWLCSDEARYITGVTLPVDAGFTVR